ncbi:peptidoglycan DD-metalloendopeptidase family protein [Petroclostridium sp. X23]|uniref:peptidoglycan DD-metalloendopeptidase family protein n=1 Tax=Petroclostridium sp. X23 TaxID=3045146 RepID=UPI0024AC84E9|nr:peptidoglycan DD-metalloendopeptidase family protein [Petroclostridium sp. X23]WHH57398.1 peptidoglycan DD-metalloendopeptidase family protein [Petroclostridium sp. X23]
MAIKAEGIRSSAYMQAFNRANKKGGTSARRNCVAVPEVKMPKLKIKPPTMELERRAVHRLKLFIATRRTVALISAICIAFFLIAGLIENSQYKSAVEVQFNGQTIGVVSSEEEFEKYFSEAKAELSQFLEGNEVYVEQKPILIGRRVKENAFSATNEIKKNIKSMVDISIAAYAIIVDGKQMGLVKDETTANAVLQEIKKPFLLDDPNIKVGFANNVEIEKKYVQVGAIQQKEEVFNALSQLKEEVKQYTIKENDTLWGIAQLYKIPVEEIMRINPGVGENIQPGQQINLTVPEPILGIETRETVVYNEDIPFEVKEIEDANLYQGRRTVIDKGFNGEQKVEAEIVKVNGIETGKEVMKTYVLSQPKIQTEKVGTKPVPPKYGTGVFRRPTYGVLTSRFGTRGREWHTGIDLAGNIGDPIYASDGGKVIFAGRQGNYGLLVKISHDNEYVTYYGHCSKLLVKEGERVAKGEVIAYVGNTGRSTGPHVHFEVRKDGTPVNPLNYLNR